MSEPVFVDDEDGDVVEGDGTFTDGPQDDEPEGVPV
jgi:hypothetical protein